MSGMLDQFLLKVGLKLGGMAAQKIAEKATAGPAVPQRSVLDVAGERFAWEYNLSCEPYHAPEMTLEEANSAGFSWIPAGVAGTARIKSYRGSAKELYIPWKIAGMRVTEIGMSAFSGRSSLRRVYLPDTLDKVGVCAFADCKNLTFVRIPNRKIDFDRDAFIRCPMLVKAELRQQRTERFSRNLEEAMKTYRLDRETPYKGGEIARAPYEDAVYYVANGLVNMGHFSYRSAGTTFFSYQGRGAEETVRIPEKIGDITVTDIALSAFHDNVYVKQIFIPDTVTRIQSGAFSHCPNLEYIRIPNRADLIVEENAVIDCPKLRREGSMPERSDTPAPTAAEAVQPAQAAVYEAPPCNYLAETAETYRLDCETPYNGGEMNREAYLKSGFFVANGTVNRGTFEYRGSGTAETVRIPEKIDGIAVTKIRMGAFASNPCMKRIYLPDTVQEIDKYAFRDCPNLEYIRMPDNPQLVVKQNAISLCPKLLNAEHRAQYLEEITGRLAYFRETYRLDSGTPYAGGEIERAPYDQAVYYVANGCANLGSFSYRGGTEETVYIPRKIGEILVTELSISAFWKNPHVRRIYIPDTVTRILRHAFDDCPNLEYIRIPDNPELAFEEEAILFCPKLRREPVSAAAERAEAFRGDLREAIAEYCLDDETPYRGGETVRLPEDDAVYFVSENGWFEYHDGNEAAVYIPQKIGDVTVEAVGDGAFLRNPFVRRVYIPDTVKRIGAGAFVDCPNLEYVRIPNHSELVLEYNAFADCPKLRRDAAES